MTERVIEVEFAGGMTAEEVADMMGISKEQLDEMRQSREKATQLLTDATDACCDIANKDHDKIFHIATEVLLLLIGGMSGLASENRKEAEVILESLHRVTGQLRPCLKTIMES